ncbi:hypothetical protein QEJ31_11085 [Pigmentibacter sp. JX0631]|uniref:hypothetical protein n=1 Tax=Pigmentibacter sp. JX0631 TaxID=2976982 RepID=UPI00246923D0|nr:hypothetical protein [Pigmentibacter sp. JX0631]WGL59063.1 hypothetical protein QEJ31_11085 [Pigmentibacter sp. JX0631]
MYLLSIKELKIAILENGLSEQIQYIYLFIFIAFFSVFSEVYVFFPTTPTIFDKIQSILSILIQLVGIYLAYRMHGGKEGNSFITKFIPIYVVLAFRFIIFTLLTMLGSMPLLWGLSFLIPKDYMGDLANIFYFAYIPILEIVFYLRLTKHLKDLKDVKI